MNVAIPPSKVPLAKTRPKRIAEMASSMPVIPVALLGLFVLTALLAPWIAPHSPTAVDLSHSYQPPFWQDGGSTNHILGTDKNGRDMLSRIIYGARVSLLVVVVSVPVAGTIGVSLGMIAGYRGGWVETLLMRLVDVKLALPTILLALLFSVVWGPSLTNLMILIILTIWAVYARTTHAETLSIKERDHVLAARTLGASGVHIVLRHILPHLLNTIVILATLQIAVVVLMEATLSFLGIGIPPPTPAWGLLIADGRSVLSTAWWVSTMPGIALSLLILSANLTGDWLRDYLDPTLRRIKR